MISTNIEYQKRYGQYDELLSNPKECYEKLLIKIDSLPEAIKPDQCYLPTIPSDILYHRQHVWDLMVPFVVCDTLYESILAANHMLKITYENYYKNLCSGFLGFRDVTDVTVRISSRSIAWARVNLVDNVGSKINVARINKNIAGIEAVYGYILNSRLLTSSLPRPIIGGILDFWEDRPLCLTCHDNKYVSLYLGMENDGGMDCLAIPTSSIITP